MMLAGEILTFISYNLIWNRSLSSQMKSAQFDRKTITISSNDEKNIFKVSGSTIKFDGYLKLSKIDDEEEENEDKKQSMIRSLNYMGLKPNTKITDIKIDRIFIGSCTNGRIGDLRDAAKIVKGKKIAEHVNAMVVPGSGLVKQQAEEEKIDQVFKEAGFDWREPGCSMCLAMNADKLNPKERCASTSNRNFEGRQGRGGRTHLVSPAMAAAAAIDGYLTDVRKFNN